MAAAKARPQGEDAASHGLLIGLPANTNAEREILLQYAAWLFYERRMLLKELFGPEAADWENYPPDIGDEFSFEFWRDQPPSKRAEEMLRKAGFIPG